jgi:hypothetical protein
VSVESSWPSIQDRIWRCRDCHGDTRVATNIRQSTPAPIPFAKLLVVSLAPPFIEGVTVKTEAQSVSNNPEDHLRQFLQNVLRQPWRDVLAAGVIVLHAVKCGIIPTDEGFQNPPPRVVDRCARQHLAAEFRNVRAPVVVTLGAMAYRAVYQSAMAINGFVKPRELKLSEPPTAALASADGYQIQLPDFAFKLFAGPFIRGAGRKEAERRLMRAAATAGVYAMPS